VRGRPLVGRGGPEAKLDRFRILGGVFGESVERFDIYAMCDLPVVCH
jgi:hypothetical protein